MSYVKRPVMLKRGTTFLAWKDASKARQEDLFEMFTANFEAMQITDLPSAADYREEIKGMLWKNFESIAYVFHVFASGGSTGAGGNRAEGQGLFTMSLQEFWAFCKECHIPTPNLNLSKIDLLFVTIDSKNSRDSPHNPQRAFVLSECAEGLGAATLCGRACDTLTPALTLILT